MPDLESVYADVVWADAVTANAKGRSTDNFIVRKFRKKILEMGIFAIQAQKTLRIGYCRVIR
jgi:hypothetical protein